MEHKEFLQLIDSFIDGELSPEKEAQMREHASQCEVCAEELNAALTVREVLNGMDDDITVPLEAEAAWKRAVKTESKRRGMRNIYRVASCIAAAFVLVLGVSYFSASKHADSSSLNKTMKKAVITETSVADDAEPLEMSAENDVVLSDGISADSQSLNYDAERKYETSDYKNAVDTIKELAAEYEGTISEETENSDSEELVLTLPGENCEAFLDAIARIGTETVNVTGDLSGDTVTVKITVIKA